MLTKPALNRALLVSMADLLRMAARVSMNVFCTALVRIGMIFLLSPKNCWRSGLSFKLPMVIGRSPNTLSWTLPSSTR